MSYGPWKNVTSIHFIYFFISILIIRVDSILKLRIFVWFEWSSLFYIIDAIFYEYRFEQFIFSTQTCNFVFIFFLLKYGFAVIRLYWCIFIAKMTKFQRKENYTFDQQQQQQRNKSMKTSKSIKVAIELFIWHELKWNIMTKSIITDWFVSLVTFAHIHRLWIKCHLLIGLQLRLC